MEDGNSIDVPQQMINVYCRIRPDQDSEDQSCWIDEWDAKSVTIQKDKYDRQKFKFDQVFGPQATQFDIYENIGEGIVHDFLNGINGAIFAYGQTGSGKTYSIFGNPYHEEHGGIVSKALDQIFDTIEKEKERYDSTLKICML